MTLPATAAAHSAEVSRQRSTDGVASILNRVLAKHGVHLHDAPTVWVPTDRDSRFLNVMDERGRAWCVNLVAETLEVL